MKRPIAITFALPVESSNFLSRVSDKIDVRRNGVALMSGHIGENKLEILHTGVGQSITERRMQNFLRDQDFTCLISSGFAGAAMGGFATGDLILGENFSDPRLLSMAQRILETQAVRIVKLWTSATMVEFDAERSAIAKKHKAAAIDMETKLIASACSARGIPLLSLRVISDCATNPLPAPAKVLFDMERQRTPFHRLARYALSDPAVIGRLIRFQRHVAKARERLANAIITVITGL